MSAIVNTRDVLLQAAGTRLGSDLQPVSVVSALPSVGGYAGPKIVLLTSDNKLYRYTGAAWVATTPTTDLTGQVTDAQIAAVDAGKVTGQLTDAQIAAVAAAKVTGELVASQLAASSVTSSKLAAGAVSTLDKFAGGFEPVSIVGALPNPTGYVGARSVFLTADNKLYRYTGSAWTVAVPAADLTGQVTETQITDSAISTPKLAAGSVVTAKIAAGAVTASEIAADAVTAAKILAGAVTTAKLAAGAVTATEIAAGAITTAKIAAGAVTATEIAAGTITTNKLVANTATVAVSDAVSITGGAIATTDTEVSVHSNVVTVANTGARTQWVGAAGVKVIAGGTQAQIDTAPAFIRISVIYYLDGVIVNGGSEEDDVVVKTIKLATGEPLFLANVTIPIFRMQTPASGSHTYGIEIRIQFYNAVGSVMQFTSPFGSYRSRLRFLVEENKV